MGKNVVNEANVAEDHCPSFFQNSCPGSGDIEDAELLKSRQEVPRTSMGLTQPREEVVD